MICPCCEYPLTEGSRLTASRLHGASGPWMQIDRYRCRNCQAEFQVTVSLKKPSPLSPEELKGRMNRPGGHAR